VTQPKHQIAQGSIVWATVADKNGVRKRRPVVVLTSTDEIVLDGPFVAAAITTTFPHPTPKNMVDLPWTHFGHPATGLRKRSAAVANWLVQLQASDVEEIKGYMPTARLIQLLELVRALQSEH
jgi:precorrin isomerase